MTFNATETLERFADHEVTVLLWRTGWDSDRRVFGGIRDAVLFAKADKSAPIKVELHVHEEGKDTPIEGDDLTALYALVDDEREVAAIG